MEYTSENKETTYAGKDKNGNKKSYTVKDHSIISLARALTVEEIELLKENEEFKDGVFSYETTTGTPFHCEGLTNRFEFNSDNSKIITKPDSSLSFHSGLSQEDILKYTNKQVMNIVNYYIKKNNPIL